MKPLEILSSLPKWAKASSGSLLDSPAWAMPCRLGDVAPIGRHLVMVPGVRQREARRAQPQRGEEPLQCLFGAFAVGCACGSAQAPPVDAYAERVAPAFLFLQVAPAFFSCHFGFPFL